MKSPTRLTTEESLVENKNPILIVDYDGVLGKKLVMGLGKGLKIVFVSSVSPSLPNEYLKNILFVPFSSRFPKIPNAEYSMFFVFDSMLGKTKEMLSSFVEKAEKDRIQLFFIEHLSTSQEEIVSSLLNKYPRIKVLIYGDIFGSEVSFGQENIIQKFIADSFFHRRISLSGEGTAKTYPVFIDDVVSAILEAAFAVGSSQKIFFVFPKHAPTVLGIAREIQKVDPEVRIDFSYKNKEQQEVKIVPDGMFLLGEKYDLNKRIREVVLTNQKKKLQGRDLEQYIKEKSKYKETKRKFLYPIFTFFVFLFILPFLSTLFFSVLGIVGFSQIKSSFENSNIESAYSWSTFTNANFTVAEASFQPVAYEAGFIGLGNKANLLGQNITAARSISANAASFIDAYKRIKSIMDGKSSNPLNDFSIANLEVSDALVSIKKIEQGNYLNNLLLSKLKENDGLIDLLANFQSIAPQLIGISDKRNYLILFQNNMELRPTGGFIGSYGLLSLDNGKISPIIISDVYDADGQLKGHVEPPFAIRRYLPSEHWYLRDSNFDFDFSKAASTSALFLKTELGKNVDGVIGINVSFVKDLLGVIGGVHVSEYNEDVDSNNFFKLTEAHAEKNFFPGSTQKKDFLGAVFRAIQQKFETNKNVSYISLLNLLDKELRDKNILLAFSEPSVQSLLSVNNWSSSLLDNRVNSGTTVNDYLGINEANLGVNKVNYFIERNVSKNTIINDDGQISSELTLSYSNKSDGSWPGGDYKNYVRIALPVGAVLSSISIDGEEKKIVPAVLDPLVYERKGFISPAGLEVESYQEDGKQIYGFLLTISAGKKQKVVVDYFLSQKLPISLPSFSYDLLMLKQPGVDFIPFDFSLSYPQSKNVVSVSSGISRENGSVLFDKKITTDQNLSVSFSTP